MQSFRGQGPAPRRAVLLRVVMALFLIAGLLSMHTLSVEHSLPGIAHPAGPTGESDASMPHVGDTHPDAVTGPSEAALPTVASARRPAAMIPSPGSVAGGMADHAAEMMLCVLALLAVALMLLGPRALGWIPDSELLPLPWRVLAEARPHPRPPSLHVLSTSRT